MPNFAKIESSKQHDRFACDIVNKDKVKLVKFKDSFKGVYKVTVFFSGKLSDKNYVTYKYRDINDAINTVVELTGIMIQE